MNFIFLVDIANGIISLTSDSDISLLVYKNALHEDKQPNYKMGKGREQTLLQREHTEGPET